MTKLKENLIVLVATLFLTWSIIIFVNSSTSNLATDVLWKKNNQQENEQDVKIVFDEEKADMIIQKNIDNIASVSIEIMFDSSKINLSRDSFDSSFNWWLAEKEWWNWYDIIVQNIDVLESNDVLLNINNITKEQFDNINIGHIQIFSNNWNIMDLTSSKK